MRLSLAYMLIFLFSKLPAQAADSIATWAQWKKIENFKFLNTKAVYQQKDNDIKSIEVLDMRCEKSSIGLYTGKSQTPYMLIAEGGLSALFNSKLSSDTAGQILLAVVRDLWINESNNFFYKQGEGSRPHIDTINSKKELRAVLFRPTKIKCAIDVFILNEGKYYPLTRLDTTFTSTKVIASAAEELVNEMFSLLNKKITSGIYSNHYLSKKSGDRITIERNYSQRFHIPALMDRGMKKGVYYSWEQFKYNQPDNRSFRIQVNDKEPPTLYVREENGTENVIRDVFAVSNGKQIYKMHQGYVFEIYRNQNTIYWMGLENYDARERSVPVFFIVPGAYGMGTEAVGMKVKFNLSPYLLDIETGKEY